MKKLILLFIGALIFPSHLLAETKTLLRPGGTTLTYEIFGEKAGDPNRKTLFIIHCWACNRHFWDQQVQELAKDYRVITLDLPGHGDSPTQRKDWTLQAMDEEIATLARELGLKKFVVVGHSMGGPLGLGLAALMPGEVKGVVCVDTLHNVEGTIPGIDEAIRQFRQDFKKSVEGFLPTMVHPKSDKSVTSFILEQAFKTDPQVALSLFEQFATMDLKTMMSQAKVPIRCVNSIPFNEKGFKTEAEINRKYGDFQVIFMKDVGHYPMLEKPKAFIRYLKKAIQAAWNGTGF